MPIRKFNGIVGGLAGFGLLVSSAFMQSAGADDEYLTEEELYGDPGGSGEIGEIWDPIEPVNRVTFRVNDFIYTRVVDPVADGYETVTTPSLRKGTSNFFDNLGYPVRLAGNLLQGKVKGALKETGRFAINTTAGVGGILNPADDVEALDSVPAEDTGQAFGAWGIGEGPYLVLPLFGPSNLRDLGGLVADRAVHPLDEPFSVIDWEVRLGLSGGEFIARSPDLMERYEQMKKGALDPYSAMMNGYTQARRAAIEE